MRYPVYLLIDPVNSGLCSKLTPEVSARRATVALLLPVIVRSLSFPSARALSAIASCELMPGKWNDSMSQSTQILHCVISIGNGTLTLSGTKREH